jgi:protein-L-isoaspartate(D-aspartate) O-methyltransferase
MWLTRSAIFSKKRQAYAAHDGERFLDAVQNARLVTNAERYYRIMYYGSRASWNLRDEHMFNTLKTLLAYHGERSKGIVWAHNSHVGNAEATEMSARGEHNIGQLCRNEFGKIAMRSVLAPITEPWPLPPSGAGPWKSR